MLKALLQVLMFVLPWRLRRAALVRLFGYDLAPGARIGFSVVLVKRCQMAADTRIGHLSMIKGLEELRIEPFGLIGNLNWITGFPMGGARHFQHETARWPSLFVGAHAAITHRHIIDCTDRVSIGAYATLAGFRSQILTHSIDLKANRQSCQPISIGAYCFVGTATVLLKGSALPDRSVLGAGSVLTKAMTEPGMLYSGVPAKLIRPIDAESGYFTRAVGYVD